MNVRRKSSLPADQKNEELKETEIAKIKKSNRAAALETNEENASYYPLWQ
jgi:hypothetical protein